ncbi:hypothetical protein SETIT_7G248400v2 [Setaria italica]|uniref:Uncharacterized protein n=2 Tax=Setaria italica TaxID=4555 RepID=A0A368RZF4_SETIT|nr:helicase-like transcription factor CHR28 isoform X2 [Setaria italica]RCV35545.1 hypothetical protein SETIT_7G248400v2 [Setaria italica]
MIVSNMDIIDLSSDSEGDIIDLSSDSDGNNEFHSWREDDTDYEDPVSPFELPLFPLSTALDQYDNWQIAKKEYDDWFNSRNASSSYSPVENRSTTEMSSGVSNDIKRDIPLSITYGSAAKSEPFHGPNVEHQFPQSFTNGNFSPQSFASNHSSLGDNRIKEEPAVKFGGFQRCTANGNGMSSSTIPTDDVFVCGGSRSHRIFPPPMPPRTSVNDAKDDDDIEKRLFGLDERAVYEEALKHIIQEKREEDLPEGVMSVSLLKHQKIALAWMLSKENSSHCSGGILADDQGLGKTISTIALIQKEKVKQSRFMTAGSYCTNAVPNIDDDDDDVVIAMDKKELKVEPLKKLDDSARLNVSSSLKLCDDDVVIVMDKKELKVEPPLERLDDSARLNVSSSLKLCDSQSGAATDIVESRKKTRMRSSASTLRSKTRPTAGTLVVCPASVLRQWANELSVKVTEGAKLSVLVYHGGSRTRDPNELAKYDVVVTTYMTVANEVPKENSDDEKYDIEMSGICPEFCAGSKRKRLPKKQSKAKKKNKPSNSDGGPLARVKWFRVVLDEAQTIKNYRTQVSRACCGLMAERRWCLSGTPIQNKIDDLYSYFCFLKYEPYSKLSSFKDKIKYEITKDPVRGYKKLQAILRIILLRRTKETLIDGEPILKLPPKTIQLSKIDFTQEERAFYLTLEEGSRQKFKAYDAAGTINENYANILVLLLRLRQACDHPLLLKGQESDLVDTKSIEMAKQLPKETVTDLLEKLERGPAICSICSDPPEDAVVTTCGHVFCYQCVHESLTSNGHVCPSPLCGKKLSVRSVFTPAVLKLCTLPKLELDVISSCSTVDDKSYSICESSYISSKIRQAVDILKSIITVGDATEAIPSEMAPVKAIVFSQWTGMLDLMELSLNSSGIQFRRLDGAMSLNLREKGVNEFKNDPKVRVMLMSLKAGNLGLNMIAACHVIMLDPWWNPYAEDQAVDRAHRIGQTRPVTVSRFTVKDTVEDRILALQEKKRTMVQSAFGEDGSSGNATRLTDEDLRYLFMV